MLKSRQVSSRALMLEFSKVIPTQSMAWVVWAISACFALLQFTIQLSSSTIINGLIHDFHLSAFSAALLLSSYYYIYMVLQIPAGILIDRFGPRRLLTFGAIACVFSCYLFAHATGLFSAFVGRILLGGGLAFAFIGTLSLISRWFPIERFAFIVSIAEMVGMLGAAFSSVLLTHVVQQNGWRSSIYSFGSIAAILAVFLWVMVRDAPKRYMHQCPAVSLGLIDIYRDLGLLLKRGIVWVNALYSGLMFALITVFVGLWGINFLVLADHFSLTTASITSNMAFIGLAMGCPIVGIVDGYWRVRRWMMTLAPGLSFVVFLLVMTLTMKPLVVSTLMFLLGFFSAPYILAFAIGNEVASNRSRAASIGFVNTISVASAAILQPFVGYLLVHYSTHTAGNHTLYSIHGYHVALSTLLFCFAISIVIGLFLPERPVIPLR